MKRWLCLLLKILSSKCKEPQTPWPDGAKTVRIYLLVKVGEYEPAMYTLSKLAFTKRAKEDVYGFYGSDRGWPESAWKEMLADGKIVVVH